MNVMEYALPPNPYDVPHDVVRYNDPASTNTGGVRGIADRLKKQYPTWNQGDHELVAHHISNLTSAGKQPSSLDSRTKAMGHIQELHAHKAMIHPHLQAVAEYMGVDPRHSPGSHPASAQTRRELINRIGKEVHSRQMAAYKEGDDNWRHVGEHSQGSHIWEHVPSGQTFMANQWARPAGQKEWVDLRGGSEGTPRRWVHGGTGEVRDSVFAPDSVWEKNRVENEKHLADVRSMLGTIHESKPDYQNPVQKYVVHTLLDMLHDKEIGPEFRANPEFQNLASASGYEGPIKNRKEIKLRPANFDVDATGNPASGELNLREFEKKLADGPGEGKMAPFTGPEVRHLFRILKGEVEPGENLTSADEDAMKAVADMTTPTVNVNVPPITVQSLLSPSQSTSQSSPAAPNVPETASQSPVEPANASGDSVSMETPNQEESILGDISDVGFQKKPKFAKGSMTAKQARDIINRSRAARNVRESQLDPNGVDDRKEGREQRRQTLERFKEQQKQDRAAQAESKRSSPPPLSPQSDIDQFPTKDSPLGQRTRWAQRRDSVSTAVPIMRELVDHLLSHEAVTPWLPPSIAKDEAAAGDTDVVKKGKTYSVLRAIAEGKHIPERYRPGPENWRMHPEGNQALEQEATRASKAIDDFLRGEAGTGADRQRAMFDSFELQFLADRIAKRFNRNKSDESLKITKGDAEALHKRYGMSSRML